MPNGLRQETIYRDPYVYTAFQNNAGEIVLRKLDPRCPGPNCPTGVQGPTIVEEHNYGAGTLVGLYYEDYDGGRIWADWQKSTNEMGWARYMFETPGWNPPPGNSQDITGGSIELGSATIKAQVLSP